MPAFVMECKQCGAENTCTEGQQVFVCPFCESKNAIAKSLDTQGGLFNRANYLRRNGEYEKALTSYEEILRQDNTEYEAHWGIVLCRYGIEYVEDPAAGKRVPTIHRAQYDSILNDPEYLAACEYAPQEVRTVYEEEAAYIGRVQKEILALAQKQERYDVFLCYKETDAAGNRTEDSVLAQELEFELSKRGYRVFFARKTLSGKLGTAYEPVIFSALHSARVMVVLGTKPEHFTAVWVKNEWGRYRELIKKGEAKTLIPAYRGMSPYDLPQEFANLQALDMGKLGFVQDLCDGIDRLSKSVKQQPTAAPAPAVAPGTASLMRRAQLFMEDGDFKSAGEYIEKVLDIDPEYAPAYIGKLMVELKLRSENELIYQEKPLTEYANFQKALRFADTAYKKVYKEYCDSVSERIKEGKDAIYEEAMTNKQQGDKDSKAYIIAAKLFRSISGYRDADVLKTECEILSVKKREEENRSDEEFFSNMKRISKERENLSEEFKRIRIFGRKRKNETLDLLERAEKETNELLINHPAVITGRYYSKIKKGEKIFFGRYAQRWETNNMKMAIEWRVLSIENRKALLLSEMNLDCKPYNKGLLPITWETCTLRAWLNNEFINTAFLEEEKKRILLSTIQNDSNPEYGTYGGNNTQDRLFLLSINELERYPAGGSWQAANTTYAKRNSAYDHKEFGLWWLRSPGGTTYYASGVNASGSILMSGCNVNDGDFGVRPALYLNLES